MLDRDIVLEIFFFFFVLEIFDSSELNLDVPGTTMYPVPPKKAQTRKEDKIGT